jgi:predicted dehydrogenase
LSAAEHGKHVICEKPLALTVDETRRMVQAVEQAGIKHMVCHNYRFIPAVRLAYDLIQKGIIGDIYSFRGVYLQEVGHNPEEVIENTWYAATGSGVLLGIGSHVIDIARFLVGEIRSVSGMVKTFNTVRRTASGAAEQVIADEANMSLMEFENGAVGTIESSGVSAGRKNQLAWEINGTRASIGFDLENPNYLQVYNAEGPVKEVQGFSNVSVTTAVHPLQVLMLPPAHNQGWEYGHVHAISHFVDCVVNDRPVAPLAATFEDGHRTQVIMEAIVESSKTGKRIELEYEGFEQELVPLAK